MNAAALASPVRDAAERTQEAHDVHNVVVTGAGLVGAHVTAAFSTSGAEVALADVAGDQRYVARVAGHDAAILRCDATRVDDLERMLKRLAPDVVVHTAGVVGRAARSDPFMAFRTNAYAAACVAHASQRAGIRRVCLISSLAVYGRGLVRAGAPVGEDFSTQPATAYGRSKLAGELALSAVADGVEIVVLRPCGIFGDVPRAGGGIAARAFVAAVQAATAGRSSIAIGPGVAGAELLYAPDIGTAAWRAATTPCAAGRVYNIGTGRIVTTTALREAFAQAMGVQPVVETTGTQTPLDVSAATRDLGFVASWELTPALTDLARRLSRTTAPATARKEGRRR